MLRDQELRAKNEAGEDVEAEESSSENEKEGEKSEIASGVEKFLAKSIVPEIFTNQGRISILAVYAMLVIVAAYGCSQVTIDFSIQFFVNEGAYVYDFF